ncbi:MAG: TSUP family transporter [Candidatus Heimdallarchaeota archaeon]|nr:TSUP family transporter [Candidatus Heimdallarchaeota archaeon]
MAFEFVPILLILSVIAFVTQFIDSALGMGFGTAATPILLILGYAPGEIVPAILLTEFLAGVVVTITHGILKNIQFRKTPKKEIIFTQKKVKETNKHSKNNNPNQTNNNNEKVLEKKGQKTTTSRWIRKILDKFNNLTEDAKVVIILGFFAVIGTITAGVLSVVFEYSDAFTFGVKLYIGAMIFSIGIILLIFRNKEHKISWSRIISLGALAGFNKGISGGGYGPLTVAGQILSGRDGTHAIASTLFSETIAVFTGTITYILTHIFVSLSRNTAISWEYLQLAPYLILGAVLAAPLAALVTNKIESKWLKIGISYVTIFLGLFSLVRVILFHSGIWNNVPKFVEMI